MFRFICIEYVFNNNLLNEEDGVKLKLWFYFEISVGLQRVWQSDVLYYYEIFRFLMGFGGSQVGKI